jgi:hypothetical protein
MGFFDSWSDLVAAATPWSTVEAEAVSGGASSEKTPAQKDVGGEGEAIVCGEPYLVYLAPPSSLQRGKSTTCQKTAIAGERELP